MDPAQYAPYPPGSAPPASLAGKAAAACRRHGAAAAALIAILVLAVAYLVARLRGWEGGIPGRAPAPPRGRAKARAPRGRAPDDEIDSLIAEIEA